MIETNPESINLNKEASRLYAELCEPIFSRAVVNSIAL